MKKFLILAPILASLLLCISCNSEEDTSSSVSIEARIEALEDAINSHSFQDYYECFDESTSLYDTYNQTTFDADYPGGIQYTFSSDITITGDTATVTSTKSTTGTTTYDNTFVMVQTDGDWYIKSWDEDGTDIFYKKR